MDVIAYIIGVLIFVVVLGASIALHEIGHLVPAKIFKVPVTQYMVGFGPTIWSRQRGETEYGIKAIPLGGYIRMVGMFPPHGKEGVTDNSTGLFNSVIDEARNHARDELKGWDENRAFYKLSAPKKLTIMLAGPFMNLVIAAILLGTLVVFIGDPRSAEPTTTINTVVECIVPAGEKKEACTANDPKAPANEAGLRPGDELTTLNGQPIANWNALRDHIRESPGDPVQLTVLRDGNEMVLTVVPRLTDIATFTDDGEYRRNADGSVVTEQVGYLGVSPQYKPVPGTVLDVPAVLWSTVWGTAKIVAKLPQKMVGVAQAAFGSAERDPEGPIGIVGVGRLTGEAASMDNIDLQSKVALLLSILGGLNVALFVFNLIPLLPFDGGHAAGATWEAIRRAFAKLRGAADPGPVDVARFLPLTYMMSILLIAMSVMLLYADIVRPLSLRG